jgi:cytochrome c oxidase subunit 3
VAIFAGLALMLGVFSLLRWSPWSGGLAVVAVMAAGSWARAGKRAVGTLFPPLALIAISFPLPLGLDTVFMLELKKVAVLVSSSGTIAVAEHFLGQKRLWAFRAFLLLTMAMGSVFLYGQASEWSGLSFGFTSGTFGGLFYLLTGFHGLHVATGILLMGLMLVKSFIPGIYNAGEEGVKATSLFWHFVDVIWIILFVLLYAWRA